MQCKGNIFKTFLNLGLNEKGKKKLAFFMHGKLAIPWKR